MRTSVPRLFVFRHPLVRRAVYETVPAGRRLAAHARAADSLAERGAPAAERAHHVAQSARPGDEAAIDLLLGVGAAAAGRAPAAAARWYEEALRLLTESDRERQIGVRIALASALTSLGELERSRAFLLEAVDLLPAERSLQQVELTTSIAAVEHWLGRHDEAHARLTRAWEELPDSSTPEAAVLEIELAVDGLYELDFERTIEMGTQALATARAVGDASLIAAAAAVLCLGETVAGHTVRARARREEARHELDRLSDADLAPRLEAVLYLAWAENYLELYDDSGAHALRGVAIARATGEGRLLPALMLVQNFAMEMQGKLAEAIAICDAVVEMARLSASPHELYRALFELGWTRYYAGDLDGAIAAYEECAGVDPRLAGATIPNGGGGPGWGLGVALFEAGEVERGRAILIDLGGDEDARTMPVERCYDWESLTLVELAAGNLEAADEYARRAEEDAARLDLRLPTALALRSRAAVLLARGEPREAARLAHESAAAAAAVAANLQAAFSRSLEARALIAAGEREAGDCAAAGRRAAAGRVRIAARARRDAERAAPARLAPRPQAGLRRDRRSRRALEARARGRGPDRRPQDEPRDRRGPVPECQNGRVPHPQHLRQARRLLPRRGGTGLRARGAPGRRGVAAAGLRRLQILQLPLELLDPLVRLLALPLGLLGECLRALPFALRLARGARRRATRGSRFGRLALRRCDLVLERTALRVAVALRGRLGLRDRRAVAAASRGAGRWTAPRAPGSTGRLLRVAATSGSAAAAPSAWRIPRMTVSVADP